MVQIISMLEGPRDFQPEGLHKREKKREIERQKRGVC